MEKDFTIMKNERQCYCFECHFTIWKDELVKFSGKKRHLNCIKSLKDSTPRKLNGSYVGRRVSKNQMVNILKYKQQRKRKNRSGKG